MLLICSQLVEEESVCFEIGLTDNRRSKMQQYINKEILIGFKFGLLGLRRYGFHFATFAFWFGKSHAATSAYEHQYKHV